MKIVALISTYQEQELLPSVIASAESMHNIFIFDGPIGAKLDSWKELETLDFIGGIIPFEGEWISDASKRTSMLNVVKTIMQDEEDVWGLWLDGDEILLWGEYLHDHCRRAEQETGTGGTAIKIVEYDGSVANCFGKLIRLDAVKRYVMSSFEIELTNGITLALPNVPICTAGGIPIGTIGGRDDPILAINRPPLQGEPHLLHRHGLRDKERRVERLHDTEAESFQQLVKDAGLEGVDIYSEQTTAKGDFPHG